jgi:hypothetical protein
MLFMMQAASGEPSFWRSLITDIPVDPGAIFVYLLIAGSVVIVWRASRKKDA